MKYRRFCIALLIVWILLVHASSQGKSKIEGYVRDGKTGAANSGVRVDVYPSDDHSRPISYTQTDSRGYYSFNVPPGKYYDVYVRMGNVNPTQRTSSATVEDGIYTINFDLYADSSYSNVVVEKYGLWLVAAVAALILGIIMLDILFRLIFRGRRREAAPAPGKADAGADSMEKLAAEKNEVESMIELSRTKYHRREIDEESFREIVRDHQKKIIEIEARMKSLGGGEPKG